MDQKDISSLYNSIQLTTCTLIPLEACDPGAIADALATMEPWHTLGYSIDTLFTYMTRPDPALNRFGIAVGESMAGIFCVRFPWLSGPFLELMAIFQAFQRKGLGREIMQWIEIQAGLTSKNLWTTTSSFNSSARSFYGGLGFIEVTILADLVKKGYDEILLRKHLNP